MTNEADGELVIDELMIWEIRNWITGKLEFRVIYKEFEGLNCSKIAVSVENGVSKIWS